MLSLHEHFSKKANPTRPVGFGWQRSPHLKKARSKTFRRMNFLPGWIPRPSLPSLLEDFFQIRKVLLWILIQIPYSTEASEFTTPWKLMLGGGFNQPTWKILYSTIWIISPNLGMNLKKYSKPPPRTVGRWNVLWHVRPIFRGQTELFMERSHPSNNYLQLVGNCIHVFTNTSKV